MKSLIIILTLLITSSGFSQSESKDLIGNWKIDLRPTADSDAYYQYFNVNKIDENILEGTFYGSPVKNGLINKNWDRLYFAFSTSDSSNDYYHTGYIQDGKIHGISYCPNRNFTAPWTGVKK